MTGIIRPLDGLEKVLRYEPETGALYWRFNISRKTRANTQAGSLSDKGYIIVQYEKKSYRAHRIAWYLHTGEDPGDKKIDHIDGDKSNNKFCNLRLASDSENARNRKKQENFTSKYKGVHWHKTKQKWRATIMHNRRAIFLGYFKNEYEAHLAYCKAALELHGEFANFG